MPGRLEALVILLDETYLCDYTVYTNLLRLIKRRENPMEQGIEWSEDLMTIYQAAELTNVDHRTIRSNINCGRLPSFTTQSGKILVKKSDLIGFRWRNVGKPPAIDLPHPSELLSCHVVFELRHPEALYYRAEHACRAFHEVIRNELKYGGRNHAYFYNNLTLYRKHYPKVPTAFLRGVVRFNSQHPGERLPGIPLYEKGAYKRTSPYTFEPESALGTVSMPRAYDPLFMFEHDEQWMIYFDPKKPVSD